MLNEKQIEYLKDTAKQQFEAKYGKYRYSVPAIEKINIEPAYLLDEKHLGILQQIQEHLKSSFTVIVSTEVMKTPEGEYKMIVRGYKNTDNISDERLSILSEPVSD